MSNWFHNPCNWCNGFGCASCGMTPTAWWATTADTVTLRPSAPPAPPRGLLERAVAALRKWCGR